MSISIGIDLSTAGFSYAVLEPVGQRFRVIEYGTLAPLSLDGVYREARALRAAYPEALAGVELLGEYPPRQTRMAALYQTAYVAGAVQAAGFAGVPSSGANAWRYALTGRRCFASNSEANTQIKAMLKLILVGLPRSNEDQRDAMAIAYVRYIRTASQSADGADRDRLPLEFLPRRLPGSSRGSARRPRSARRRS